jgi:hypothetical protein
MLTPSAECVRNEDRKEFSPSLSLENVDSVLGVYPDGVEVLFLPWRLCLLGSALILTSWGKAVDVGSNGELLFSR